MLEDIFGFLLFLGFPISLVLVAHFLYTQRQRNLKKFAAMLDKGSFTRFGFEPREYNREERVEGRIDGFKVSAVHQISGFRKSIRSSAMFCVEVPFPAGQFSVSRASFASRLGAKIGFREDDVQLGKEALDDNYHLEGDPDVLQKLFRNKNAELAFEQVFSSHSALLASALGSPADSVSLVGRGDLGLLSYTQNTPNRKSYYPDKLMKLSRHLVEIAKLCSRRQVSLPQRVPEKLFTCTGGRDQSLCPYCRSDLKLEGEDIVHCDHCKTLHHKACFEEAKSCTVFGCSGGAKERTGDRKASKA